MCVAQNAKADCVDDNTKIFCQYCRQSRKELVQMMSGTELNQLSEALKKLPAIDVSDMGVKDLAKASVTTQQFRRWFYMWV